MCFGVVNPPLHSFLKAVSTPTLVEISRLRGLSGYDIRIRKRAAHLLDRRVVVACIHVDEIDRVVGEVRSRLHGGVAEDSPLGCKPLCECVSFELVLVLGSDGLLTQLGQQRKRLGVS